METTETKTETRAYGRAAREGLKGLFKAQTILLDLANAQNAVAFKAVRERMKAEKATPAAALIDSAEEIVEGMLAMQKSIVDFGTERAERAPKAEAEAAAEEGTEKKRTFPRFPFAELVRKNFEASVTAQRELLGLFEKQGKLGVKVADGITRKSVRTLLNDAAAAAKEAVENALETQGKLVELAAKQGKENIGLIADQEKPLISKSTAKYMEEGIDNARRAQTKLIGVAFDVNARMYERVEAPAADTTTSKIAERIEKGIERAVKAQNEVLDASLRAVNRTAVASSN
jgi:hypothetical protein